MKVYTLWASMKDEMEPSPWMIAAEDEFSWEGDPDRCEAVFKVARDLAERNDWDVREVEVSLPYEQISGAFGSPTIVGEVNTP